MKVLPKMSFQDKPFKDLKQTKKNPVFPNTTKQRSHKTSTAKTEHEPCNH